MSCYPINPEGDSSAWALSKLSRAGSSLGSAQGQPPFFVLKTGDRHELTPGLCLSRASGSGDDVRGSLGDKY